MSLENLLVDKEYSITEAAEFLEVTDQTVGKCLCCIKKKKLQQMNSSKFEFLFHKINE